MGTSVCRRFARKILPSSCGNCSASAGSGSPKPRLAEAVASLESSLKIDPRFACAYNALGVALSRMKRHKEARVAFEREAELTPERALPSRSPRSWSPPEIWQKPKVSVQGGHVRSALGHNTLDSA